jgi:proteasome lid subunit RPN8/RPN11|tara:strand:+ start:43 stop:354 length:312 start_codon:yes stop_codon:yes gene_type:complete
MMEEIYTHASKEAPRECCGLVVQDGNNEKYIPLENISENERDFKIDPKTFVMYQLISKIKYVVHSHYNQDCHPSEVDKKQCREVGIPYLIVSYPDKEYTILQP